MTRARLDDDQMRLPLGPLTVPPALAGEALLRLDHRPPRSARELPAAPRRRLRAADLTTRTAFPTPGPPTGYGRGRISGRHKFVTLGAVCDVANPSRASR